MLKSKALLECSVNERIGHFYCDNDTPVPVAKEMLNQFKIFLEKIEEAAAKAKEELEKKPEEIKDELKSE